MNLDFFPPLNAALNGLAGVFLVAGFLRVKRGDRKGHAACMVAALAVSAVFLASYVTFKALKGNVHTVFPESYPLARKIYYPMLISHIILAVGMLPLIFLAVRHAVKGNLESHRRMVRWAYPIWLYVSVTGVLVYFMLYQWFLPAEAVAGETAALTVPGPAASAAALAGADASAQAPALAEEPREGGSEASLAGGGLVFEPGTFVHRAAEGETRMTAAFTATNPGPDPVAIVKVESNCACLKAESDLQIVPPGGQARVTAVFDISRLSGEAEKSVYVTTDQPGARETRLAVRVAVPPVVEVEPSSVKWAVGEDPAPRQITFRVLREAPIRVLEASSSRQSVAVELETIEEGREYRITLLPESTSSVLLGFVRITTDCELEQHQQHMAYYTIQDSSPRAN